MRTFFVIVSVWLLSACSTTSVGSIYSSTLQSGAEPPPRDVFVVIDGTGNSAISRTNAARLFEIVDSSDQSKRERPLATYYAEGVGSRGQLLGLAVGSGLDKDVRDAYSFLTKAYRPGKDELVLSGFSRGAYSVRALGGLISLAGVPDLSAETPKKRKKIVKQIFAAYKDKRRSVRIPEIAKRYGFDLPEQPGSAKIRAMVLWDTVGARGLPNRSTDGTGELDRYHLTACNVALTLHAMSLDDNRAYSFTPISADGSLLRAGCEQDEAVDIEEVWFSGAHADVGGTYAPDQLTEGYLPGVSLNWALRRLKEYKILDDIPHVLEDRYGPIHDAKKAALYYRGLSEYYRRPFEFQKNFGIEGKLQVHTSVFERLERARELDAIFPQCPRNRSTSDLPILMCADNLAPVVPPIPTFVNIMLDRGCMIRTDRGFDLAPDQQCIKVIDH